MWKRCKIKQRNNFRNPSGGIVHPGPPRGGAATAGNWSSKRTDKLLCDPDDVRHCQAPAEPDELVTKVQYLTRHYHKCLIELNIRVN